MTGQFHDVVMPEFACKDILRVEDVPIEITSNGTIEDRSTPVRWGGFKWTIKSIGNDSVTMNILTSFFRQRHYRQYSFKYRDPAYPELDNEVLGHYSGTGWKLYLSDYDTDGVTKIAGSHPVFLPDMPNIDVTVNGSPDSGTFSVIDGEPILTIPGSISTDEVKVSGPYWLAARLSGSWGWTVATLNDSGPNSGRTVDIVLNEVFEY